MAHAGFRGRAERRPHPWHSRGGGRRRRGRAPVRGPARSGGDGRVRPVDARPILHRAARAFRGDDPGDLHGRAEPAGPGRSTGAPAMDPRFPPVLRTDDGVRSGAVPARALDGGRTADRPDPRGFRPGIGSAAGDIILRAALPLGGRARHRADRTSCRAGRPGPPPTLPDPRPGRGLALDDAVGRKRTGGTPEHPGQVHVECRAPLRETSERERVLRRVRVVPDDGGDEGHRGLVVRPRCEPAVATRVLLLHPRV